MFLNKLFENQKNTTFGWCFFGYEVIIEDFRGMRRRPVEAW